MYIFIFDTIFSRTTKLVQFQIIAAKICQPLQLRKICRFGSRALIPLAGWLYVAQSELKRFYIYQGRSYTDRTVCALRYHQSSKNSAARRTVQTNIIESCSLRTHMDRHFGQAFSPCLLCTHIKLSLALQTIFSAPVSHIQ